MKQHLSNEDIMSLINQQGDLLISIYLDTDPKQNIKKSTVKFKDLLSRAKITLDADGHSPDRISEILEPAYNLLQDDGLWKKQMQGLACFINKRELESYILGSDMPNLIILGKKYHLKPLIRYKTNDLPFWILSVSKDDPVLYRASRQFIRKVDDVQLPSGLEEIRQTKDGEEESVQFHTKTRHRLGQRSAIHHGHGEPGSFEEKALKKYLLELSNALENFINPFQEPLILAGGGHLLSIIREMISYPYLVDESIEKNITHNRTGKLLDLSWEILQPKINDQKEAVREEFEMKRGTQETSEDLHEIINASQAGTIRSLLIKDQKNIWGVYDPLTGKTTEHQQQLPESIDLLSLIVEEVFKKERRLYFYDQNAFPGKSDAAAILYK